MIIGLMLLVAGLVMADEIVLFDAVSTPVAAVQGQSGAKFVAKDGLLEVETKGETGYPGVLIKGSWDLSKCNRVTFELANRDNKGELPLTVRLDNVDADAGKSLGVFIDRIKIKGRVPNEYTVPLPPALPHGREITSKLAGMRKGPLDTTGVAADLDSSKVVGVAVYIKEPKLDWKWGVKRIVAHTGPMPEVPAWMKLPADKFFPFIDKYGQFKYKDWPGKIHSDKDLKAACEREKIDLEQHPGPKGWSKFGGWADGPKRKATGHFRVEKIDGKWWMVDPEGYLYWSHGPVRVTPSTAITPLDDREFYFTDLPGEKSPFAKFYTTRDELLFPYYEKRNIKRTYDFSSANNYRKYGDSWYETFADMAHKRLRSWGLNTIANSSDKRICAMDRTPYTDRFELKSKPLAGSHDGWWPFRDPFDPSFRADVRRLMKEHKQEMDDPWCFGFFVDNELSWGSPTDLAAWTLASPPDQVAKIEFINRLKKKYGEIGNLNKVWGSEYRDWDAMLAETKRPGAGAKDDLTEFTLVIADAYFKNIREEFKAAAPNKLYMGCRFAGRGPEFALRAGATYCDLVSFNIYARSLDDFKLPADVDKAVMIGEFHFGALDRGLFHPGLIQLKDQDERACVYIQYVTSALQHQNVVGVHWHQFGDQATTGRFDGENFQVGFVDCCDTPYWETVNAIRQVGYDMYSIRSGSGPSSSKVDMQRIANEKIFLSLSPDGRKFELGFAGEGSSVSGDGGLFDMLVGVGEWHESRLEPGDQKAEVRKDGESLVARYGKLRHKGIDYEATVELRFTLDADKVVCTAQLENRSKLVIEEFWFPWVGPFCSLSASQEEDTLIVPQGFGRRVKNPANYVLQHHTAYMAPDQRRVLACAHYPGDMSMNWFGFYGGGRALGLLSLDETFQTTGLNVSRDTATGLLSAGFVRYPFLKKGNWTSPKSVVRLHRGDWHNDADVYRGWADKTWWSISPRPQWVDRMHGWQRIIMKHQYGEIFYRFKDLVDVYEGGKPYGITTLFVFGWFRGGMDNSYPDYTADKELGGEEGLRQAIAEVRRRGGHVILYANGHLIDVDTAFYRKTGKKICLKTSQGSEYREAYKFSGDGTFLRSFGARSFVAGCQSAPQWREKLLEIGRYMLSFNPDGIFYDQMGGCMPYLCFDESHPHKGPAMAQGPGKNATLAVMRKELISGHPDRTIGTEHVTDCLGRHMDFLHNATYGSAQGPETMPEIFRYTFPELIESSRQIRDERDHVKRMNWTFLYGWRFDVEIWRCRGDLRYVPEYGAYMAKLNALRDRWPELLMTGKFVDETFFEYDCKGCLAKGYVAGDRAAIVVVNNALSASSFAPKVNEQWRFVEGSTVSDSFKPGDTLPAQSVAVLVYTKGGK